MWCLLFEHEDQRSVWVISHLWWHMLVHSLLEREMWKQVDRSWGTIALSVGVCTCVSTHKHMRMHPHPHIPAKPIKSQSWNYLKGSKFPVSKGLESQSGWPTEVRCELDGLRHVFQTHNKVIFPDFGNCKPITDVKVNLSSALCPSTPGFIHITYPLASLKQTMGNGLFQSKRITQVLH